MLYLSDMALTNKSNLPGVIERAVANDPYESSSDISTTRLIAPPRIRVLEKKYADQVEEDRFNFLSAWQLCSFYNRTSSIR